jgi:glucoamylase
VIAADTEAFGRPGIAPTWTSSKKDLVTTALGPSRLWATLGYGILNEVYWPATGQPQLRDLGFIVAGPNFWVEVKRAARYRLNTPEPYIPLPRIVHEGEEYQLILEFLPDPLRDVLLVHFELKGGGLRLYPLLAPHLGMSGWNNTAWVDDGLFAQRNDLALCLLAAPTFDRMSAGYVGSSDGWQDFARNGRMTWTFARADEGNVALMGEIEATEGILALGFGSSPAAARTLAASSLADGYGRIRDRFTSAWRAWGHQLRLPEISENLAREACLSAAMLKVHEDRTFPGAMVASLSIPWGNTSNDPGGYHLVWPRDAVEAGLGLLAAGEMEDAGRLLAYLAATQNADGGWCQNFFPAGRPYWRGVQLDEAGFPILLTAKMHDLHLRVSPQAVSMVRQAAGYLVRHGPVSPQDRWEENPVRAHSLSGWRSLP